MENLKIGNFENLHCCKSKNHQINESCDNHEKIWIVYLLNCSDNTIYTGITNCLIERLIKHSSGKGAKYTKARLPVTLIKFFEVANKSEALKLEIKIKKFSRQEKLML